MVNCAILDDEPTARQIMEIHIQEIPVLKLVGQCRNAVELLNLMAKQPIDLLFLDINMPDISGISLAKSLSKDVKVIFTTAHREYAVEGFDLQAVDYLLKPISPERLKQGVEKFLREHQNSKEQTQSIPEFLDVMSNRVNVRIPFDEILYIESLNEQLIIKTEKDQIPSRSNISAIEKALERGDFLRIHRSFIIARQKVSSYTKEYVVIEGEQIPISRSYKAQTANALANK